ncbi:MAG: bifunctional glutamate N-acetyltransferase/amino-acid acetyltransferase ArgJ [Oscillospiraceae bacterium]|jgi:glutamate N-acetyltransferase/amino-acid N-acetyltransferase|nr:bifunctional glutamate N-acetyltransferase/amino-acid acetyltransferase ArgJ [Oscillospiraceae bacterium]
MIIFDNYTPVDGGVCAANGFTAGGLCAGIKQGSTKPDLAIIYSSVDCRAAALYTTNKVKGAPLVVTKEHLKNGKARAIIVNSGNANTCNANGLEIAEKMCEITARELRIDPDDVIVASTGVIGQPLSIEPFETHIPLLATELTRFGGDRACLSIMTTDTRQKQFAVEFMLGGKTCFLGGICKGSGMIHPNMATMLCFVTTDAAINAETLDKALRFVNGVTFNRVSVDGDTSTNDIVTVLANGLAGNTEITSEDSPEYEAFVGALYAVMVNLARETARDGEGATKLLECIVSGASTDTIAASVAKSVIGSSLLKAAIFAADANWGRILCAIGYAEGEFEINKVAVRLQSNAGEISVCAGGSGVPFDEDTAHEILLEDEVRILVDLQSGDCTAAAWGCDLTYDYVKINAEYRS